MAVKEMEARGRSGTGHLREMSEGEGVVPFTEATPKPVGVRAGREIPPEMRSKFERERRPSKQSELINSGGRTDFEWQAESAEVNPIKTHQRVLAIQVRVP